MSGEFATFHKLSQIFEANKLTALLNATIMSTQAKQPSQTFCESFSPNWLPAHSRLTEVSSNNLTLKPGSLGLRLSGFAVANGSQFASVGVCLVPLGELAE